MPVIIASELCRSSCTCARARSLVIQPRVVFRRGDLAIQRHRGFQRHQRLAGAHEMKKGFVQFLGFRLNSWAISTSTPAFAQIARSLRPKPADSGPCDAANTCANPAAIRASAHGPVRP